MQCPIDIVTKAKQQSLHKARRGGGRGDEDLDDDPLTNIDPAALAALSTRETEAMTLRMVRYELHSMRLHIDQVWGEGGHQTV